MPLDPFLLSYAGLASFAASTPRIRSNLRWKLPDALLMKIVGALILLAAFWRAVAHFGPYQGPVAWTGLLCLSGAAMVLIASRWKETALALALPCLLAVALVPLVAA
ncbi:MAG: DUF3325 family protein [Sphingobium sp.]